jgi:molybdopterin/thiamine biosynthesis adenylyltransferase
MMLSTGELQRYDRQIMLREIGEEGQEKLKGATIFVAGAGGLGSPVALYLAAAGVGTLRIVDRDIVDRSNLNRQVLHWENDIGREKVTSAREKLRRANPHVRVEGVCETISRENVLDLADGADGIVDAMDNVPTRHVLNWCAIEKNLPYFHGAVHGFSGRVMTILPGKSTCLRCMYRGPVPQEKFPVIGVTPGVIGSIQATEVIKYITGAGELLINRLLSFDGLLMRFTEFKVNRNPDCEHCGHLAGKE